MTRIVVTGGHLTPAMAIISQLRKIAPDTRIYFLGRKNAIEGDKAISFEYLEVKKADIPFFEIMTGRLQRKLTKKSLISLAKFPLGLAQSFFLLRKLQPDLLLTFGGYIALPVAIGAKFFQIPVVAHEQSPSLGLANKIIFKFASLKGVSSKSLADNFPDSKVIFTGPLFREEIFQTQPASQALDKFLRKVGNSKLIYITGGATGSHFINQIGEKLLPKILKDHFVIHQTGNLVKSADFAKLSELKKGLSQTLAEKYFLTEFVHSQDYGAVLNRADLVISRSGANTTAELASLGKVAIIVPLEWGKEQKEISHNLKEMGAVLVIPEELVLKRLITAIKTIFANFPKFSKKAAALQRKTPRHGAAVFVKKILELA